MDVKEKKCCIILFVLKSLKNNFIEHKGMPPLTIWQVQLYKSAV